MITYSAVKTVALSGSTPIDNLFILEHMRTAPEGYVKVYLFALMQYKNPYFANEDIALALNMSDSEIVKAFSYWQEKGLVRILRYDPLHIEFVAHDENSFVPSTSYRFNDLVKALNEVLGTRRFTSTELKTVYDWVDVFGLSEDAVIVLVAHCLDKKGQRTSVKYMDAVAKTLADANILTADEVKNYLLNQSVSSQEEELAKTIIKRWNLRRKATHDELELIRKWLNDWQVPFSVVTMACEEMVYATNPSFGYLDRILETYRERGTLDADTLQAYRKKRMEIEELTRQILNNAGIGKKPTTLQVDKVDIWCSDWHIPKDALLLLSEYASSASQPFAYMTKIVKDWQNAGIKNIDDAKKYFEGNAAGKPNKKAPNKFAQRKYSQEELSKFGHRIGVIDDGENT
jgi:DnaD/phage-associated family protein